MYSTKDIPPVELTLDFIRQFVSDHEIYEYYAGQKIKIGQVIRSPLREDKNPSWGLFQIPPDTVLWKDFSTGDTGNVITFVKKITNTTSNRKTLYKIWEDLILIKGGVSAKKRQPSQTVTKNKTDIKIKRKNFTQTDDNYWLRFGIDREILRIYNVYPISTYWINDIQQPDVYTNESPMYAYKIYSSFKIYKPLEKNKSKKWKSNTSNTELQGFQQLPLSGENLIITKSLKDVMCLYGLGFTSIAPQCETSDIPKQIIENLKTRFKNIYIFYDNDEAGIKGAQKLADKYGLPYHYIPIDKDVKDISEYVEKYGPISAIDFITDNILKNAEKSTKQESEECNESVSRRTGIQE